MATGSVIERRALPRGLSAVYIFCLCICIYKEVPSAREGGNPPPQKSPWPLNADVKIEATKILQK
jgi:hypothetical protein